MLTLRYMGSAIKIDGNTEVMIPGVLSIKNGEIVLDDVQAKVLSAVASSKKNEKAVARELAIAEAIGDGIPVLNAPPKKYYSTNPNSYTQKILAIVKPLLAVNRYNTTSLLDEVEKVMPDLKRQRANVALRNTNGREVKYFQGIWSLAEKTGNEIPLIRTEKEVRGRPINSNSLTQRVLAIVKPLLEKNKYSTSALLNEVEKVFPGINRESIGGSIKSANGIKYTKGIFSLALTDKWFSCFANKNMSRRLVV